MQPQGGEFLSASCGRALVMEYLPGASRRATPQRSAVGSPAVVLGCVLQHDETVSQQPSTHVFHLDRIVTGVRCCGYLRSGSLICDLRS